MFAALWRIESAKIIAMLTRMVRDVELAEEIAQATFVEAFERWQRDGQPPNAGAWLMTAAKHRAIDVLRRGRLLEKKHDEIAQTSESSAPADFDEGLDDVVGDDLLRLMFVACHPVLSPEGRLALTLRLLGGLTTEEIARAFLVPEPTIAQRIVRAKKTLAEKDIPWALPEKEDLELRLDSVLEAIYLVFNEGYSATAGDDVMRISLCEDALRLGRILAELLPAQSEVHGLVALMEIQASRSRARTGRNGEGILLLDQDRAKWDAIFIQRGLASLIRAEEIRSGPPGPYLLQAAIAACHARATTAEQTDWARIAAIYDALAHRAPSPIVELNRAVAHAKAFGPAVGLALVDALRDEPALRDYPHLPSVRAGFLAKLGRSDEARAEIARAIALTKNARERDTLIARAKLYTDPD